jgi:hypothetical protein
MEHRKVLCVGLYDSGLSLLLKLLLEQKKTVKYVRSAGIKYYAHTGLPPSKAVIDIAFDLGFIITSQNPSHHGIIKDAERQKKKVFYHIPAHVSKIESFKFFDAVITPYRTVYNQLIERYGVDPKALMMIKNPDGIAVKTGSAEAYPLLQTWVEERFQ